MQAVKHFIETLFLSTMIFDLNRADKSLSGKVTITGEATFPTSKRFDS